VKKDILSHYLYEFVVFDCFSIIIRLKKVIFDHLVKNLCELAPLCNHCRQATDYFSELSHSFIVFRHF